MTIAPIQNTGLINAKNCTRGGGGGGNFPLVQLCVGGTNFLGCNFPCGQSFSRQSFAGLVGVGIVGGGNFPREQFSGGQLTRGQLSWDKLHWGQLSWNRDKHCRKNSGFITHWWRFRKKFVIGRSKNSYS